MGIDRPLVIGSVLFGIGWGLVGLCPGPALENLATLSPRVIVFVVAMTGGMALQDFWEKRWPTIRQTKGLMNRFTLQGRVVIGCLWQQSKMAKKWVPYGS